MDSDLLPPELSDVHPLGSEAFAEIGQRFRECAECMDAKRLDHTIAEALWGEETDQERMTMVVRELFGLFMDLVKKPDCDLAEHLRGFAPCLLNALFRMSLSPSMGRVRVTKGSEGMPCVLIAGFAGSVLEDIRPQQDYYQSLGFTTVGATHCTYPARILQRQMARVARALEEALAGPNPRLLVHACSGQGANLFNSMINLWTGSKRPFEKLPKFSDCVSAFVWECYAPGYVDQTGDPGSDDSESDDDDSTIEAFVAKLEKQQTAGKYPAFFSAAANTLNELCEKHMVDITWWSMMARTKQLNLMLRSINPRFLKTVEGLYGEGLPLWGDLADLFGWEREMRGSGRGNAPRLYLYSTQDGLFPANQLEAALDRYWSTLRKTTKFLVQKCTKSAHCKLWVTERSQCEKSVSKLLKVAKLRKA